MSAFSRLACPASLRAMNIRALLPKTAARQFALGLGALFTLSTLSLGLTESLSAAWPVAVLAAFNLATSFTTERVARTLVMVEVCFLIVAGVYMGLIALRS